MPGNLQRVVGRVALTVIGFGLSSEAFADVVGVRLDYLDGVERGERKLTLKSVERIADQIGVDRLELLSPPA